MSLTARGRLLVNGIDISSYPYEDCWKMFSTVFQDVHYFAYSVGENVAASADIVPERVDQVLGQVGLTEMLSRHKGHDTELTRDFSEEGASCPGEKRRSLPWRGLSTGTPPSMCSTSPPRRWIRWRRKNADYIYVMKDGQIAEEGTHASLMEQQGYYHEMFTLQAKNYIAASEEETGGYATC